MNLLISVICIYVFISQVLSQEDRTVFELTDDRPSILWNPTSSESIEVRADDGYQIQIDVAQFDIDGENDNSVTVKSVSDDGEEANEIMFTYTISGKPSYLYNNNKLQADYVGTNTSNHFVLQFTRVGELLTTTTVISTSSVEPMPTPASEEPATITVYLYGLPAANFNETEINSLKTDIAKMGTEYCEVQNCPLNGSITERNVQIETLKMCSVMWEDYDACVLLTFALPIVKLDDQDDSQLWRGYQLNEAHLKILWDTYGSKYLGPRLSLYPVPELNTIFEFRIILICLVIVVLVILILLTRHIRGKIQKKRRKLSDTTCILDRTSDRISEQSLPPHYLQELPPHLTREQRKYSDYNMTFAEDDDTPRSPTITNQVILSSDVNDSDVAQA